MKSAEERYRDMLLEPTASTPVFHEVLGALLAEGASEEVLEHMDALLHIPLYNAVEWEQHAIQLACRGLISTVAVHEALGEWGADEPPQEWDTLANRVIAKRREKQA